MNPKRNSLSSSWILGIYIAVVEMRMEGAVLVFVATPSFNFGKTLLHYLETSEQRCNIGLFVGFGFLALLVVGQCFEPEDEVEVEVAGPGVST